LAPTRVKISKKQAGNGVEKRSKNGAAGREKLGLLGGDIQAGPRPGHWHKKGVFNRQGQIK